MQYNVSTLAHAKSSRQDASLLCTPLRTAEVPACWFLSGEGRQSLEPYSFLMDLSYHGSEIRRHADSRDTVTREDLRCPISGSSFGTVGFSPRREGGYACVPYSFVESRLSSPLIFEITRTIFPMDFS